MFVLSRPLRFIFSSVYSWWLHLSMGTASVSCLRSKPAMCTAAWRWQHLLPCNSRPSQSHTYPGQTGQRRSHKSAGLPHCPSPRGRGHSQRRSAGPPETEFLQPLFPRSSRWAPTHSKPWGQWEPPRGGGHSPGLSRWYRSSILHWGCPGRRHSAHIPLPSPSSAGSHHAQGRSTSGKYQRTQTCPAVTPRASKA